MSAANGANVRRVKNPSLSLGLRKQNIEYKVFIGSIQIKLP